MRCCSFPEIIHVDCNKRWLAYLMQQGSDGIILDQRVPPQRPN
jgi:hypothetical protein